MKPVEPIFVVDLFEPMLGRLLQLLRQLSEQQWRSATPCEGWRLFTKGIAKEQAREKARIQGNEALASTLFEAVAIIA
jgi:hypothetical protein